MYLLPQTAQMRAQKSRKAHALRPGYFNAMNTILRLILLLLLLPVHLV